MGGDDYGGGMGGMGGMGGGDYGGGGGYGDDYGGGGGEGGGLADNIKVRWCRDVCLLGVHGLMLYLPSFVRFGENLKRTTTRTVRCYQSKA